LRGHVERGGGLLVLGGQGARGLARYRNSPVEPLLPAVLEGVEETEREIGITPSLATSGVLHPVMRIAGELDRNRAVWAGLPPVSGVIQNLVPKPGAETLLEGEGGGRKSPLLLVSRFGSGKTAVVNASGLWRWHLLLEGYDASPDVFTRLWANAARWLTDFEGGEPFRVRPERDVVLRGEAVAMTARLFDDRYQPVDGARIEVRVTPEEANGAAPRPLVLQGSRGYYSGAFPPLPPGRYRYEATARGGRGTAGPVRGRFAVDRAGKELLAPGGDPALLERIASESGGEVVAPADAAGAASRIDLASARALPGRRLALWDHPVLFLLLVGSLTAEWFLKRRRGLP
jgi:hypothetical protein